MITKKDLPLVAKGIQEGIKTAQEGADAAAHDSRAAALQQYLQKGKLEHETQAARDKLGYKDEQGQYHDGTDVAAKQSEQENANRLLQGMMENAPAGSGATVNGVGYTKGFNPSALGAKQGHDFLKTVQGTYKPIHDQLDASQATLDNLNLGNDSGDRLALLNEAKLALAGSGGRAFGAVMHTLSGDPTMASDSQKAWNWLNNTPNLPKMPPAQRNALRESVFGRLDQLEAQRQQADQSLSQQGAIVAPGTDYSGLVNSVSVPAAQKFQKLRKMQGDYSAQRQQMPGQPPVSTPSTSDANPTTFDRLKSYFTAPKSVPQGQQAPQTQGGPPDESADFQNFYNNVWKKAKNGSGQ
jgi:hypothetical protein